MNPYEVMADDLAAVAAESGAAQPVIVWNGKNYVIFPNKFEAAQPLRSGGYSWMFDGKFTAPVAQFLNAQFPNVVALKAAMYNTLFTYLGETYKVQMINILTGGTMIEVVSNAFSQGA
jgi:hypothetical protein